MTTPDPNPEGPPGQEIPRRIRLALSRNQKQRSKLKQAADGTIVEEPEPPPPPPEPAKSGPEAGRRVKLRRSGQMHADLTAPIPPDETRDEPDY